MVTMNVFPNILAKNKDFKKLRQGFVDKKARSTTALISSCHWKNLVPFCLFVSLNTLFLMLYLANLMMIDLDCLTFLSLSIQRLQSISKSVSFSCKSSLRVSVTAVSVSSFLLSFTPCNKILL